MVETYYVRLPEPLTAREAMNFKAWSKALEKALGSEYYETRFVSGLYDPDTNRNIDRFQVIDNDHLKAIVEVEYYTTP